MDFYSNYGIDDAVSFLPTPHSEAREGVIVAVRFTKAKVWYDALDEYEGRVFKDIPSENISRSIFAPSDGPKE